jgi:hypothetical protein
MALYSPSAIPVVQLPGPAALLDSGPGRIAPMPKTSMHPQIPISKSPSHQQRPNQSASTFSVCAQSVFHPDHARLFHSASQRTWIGFGV